MVCGCMRCIKNSQKTFEEAAEADPEWVQTEEGEKGIGEGIVNG